MESAMPLALNESGTAHTIILSALQHVQDRLFLNYVHQYQVLYGFHQLLNANVKLECMLKICCCQWYNTYTQMPHVVCKGIRRFQVLDHASSPGRCSLLQRKLRPS
jgi:hypothetical protein